MLPPSSSIQRLHLLISVRNFVAPLDGCAQITAAVPALSCTYLFGYFGDGNGEAYVTLLHRALSLTFSLDILNSSLSLPPIISTSVLTENNTFDLNLMPHMNYFILEPLFITLCLSFSFSVLFYIYTYMAGGEKTKKKKTKPNPKLYAVCFNFQDLIQLDFWHLSLLLYFLASQT